MGVGGTIGREHAPMTFREFTNALIGLAREGWYKSPVDLS